jgi:pimeloyl-ACP methyl ester carboxylesterase
MATFVLIHGAGDVGWYWHLVEEELRKQGHEVVAPDLPCDDDTAGLPEYVDTVIDEIGDRRDLVVVGQSFGGFSATLVADRIRADVLVLVAGMVPAPGEKAEDWFANTGWEHYVQQQARRNGGKTGNDDPFVVFYHDVPRAVAEEALRKERAQSATPGQTPWPLESWPAVPTRFVLCSEDRFFPPEFMRRVVAARLAMTADEIPAGHCVALSRPKELAGMLLGYLATSRR